jgi:hypothetical protein
MINRALARFAVFAGALLSPGLVSGQSPASPPIYGSYVISARLFCASPVIAAGASFGNRGQLPLSSESAAFLSMQANFTPAKSATYAYWLSSLGVPDPTNTTTFAQLGFGQSDQHILEAVIEWGNLNIFAMGTSITSAGKPGYGVVPATGYGKTQFIVTRFLIPTTPQTFSEGYLLYVWSPANPLIPLGSPYPETYSGPASTGPASSLNPFPNSWQQQAVFFTRMSSSRASTFSASGAYRTVLLNTPTGIAPGASLPPSCAAIQQWDGVASE